MILFNHDNAGKAHMFMLKLSYHVCPQMHFVIFNHSGNFT